VTARHDHYEVAGSGSDLLEGLVDRQVEGSGPQVVGASLLLREDGSFDGTIGGGAVEDAAIREAVERLKSRRSGMLRFNLAAELGMCCGGVMHIFCEVLEPTRRLILYGAGHVAQPTAKLAAEVGFEVWVVDDRDDWANRARFPSAQNILHLEVDEAFDEIAPRAKDMVVVVTRGHEEDQRVLEHYLCEPPSYLGVIGSLSKTTRAIARCRAKGVSDDLLSRVAMPVGLDIGAVTPSEIAISIVAELVAHHRGRQDAVFPASMSAHSMLHRTEQSRPPEASAIEIPSADSM